MDLFDLREGKEKKRKRREKERHGHFLDRRGAPSFAVSQPRPTLPHSLSLSLSLQKNTPHTHTTSQELNGFLAPTYKEELVVDRSPPGELLRVNFNVSFPSLPCEFATLDVSDALGTKRLNLTKTVRKLPLGHDGQRAGFYTHDDGGHSGAGTGEGIAYDPPRAFDAPQIDYSAPIDAAHFQSLMEAYPIVVVNFFAPWCSWCQRLAPTWVREREEKSFSFSIVFFWSPFFFTLSLSLSHTHESKSKFQIFKKKQEEVTQAVHEKYPEETRNPDGTGAGDGRIRFAKVDCTAEVELCRQHAVTGFPSIRVFRAGHDEVNAHGYLDHESYRGDRTKESLLSFADGLAASAGSPHEHVRGVSRQAAAPGCALSGFVLAKKVPGTLHFIARAPGHSFDFATQNLSHVVGEFSFGSRPSSPRRLRTLAAMHPLGLSPDWADKLAGQAFISQNERSTFEHHARVVLTSIEPRRGGPAAHFDAYEYTVHSHAFVAEAPLTGAGATDGANVLPRPAPPPPAAKFSFDVSPIQIVVTEQKKALYHFVTSTCAVVGGVFTVAGIVDGVVHSGKAILAKKKGELGKLG